jgi:hypothetical protein
MRFFIYVFYLRFLFTVLHRRVARLNKRKDIIKRHHCRFTEDAFRAMRIAFRHIKSGCTVLRAMTAWATKVDRLSRIFHINNLYNFFLGKWPETKFDEVQKKKHQEISEDTADDGNCF